MFSCAIYKAIRCLVRRPPSFINGVSKPGCSMECTGKTGLESWLCSSSPCNPSQALNLLLRFRPSFCRQEEPWPSLIWATSSLCVLCRHGPRKIAGGGTISPTQADSSKEFKFLFIELCRCLLYFNSLALGDKDGVWLAWYQDQAGLFIYVFLMHWQQGETP